jgi:hypothetical protein
MPAWPKLCHPFALPISRSRTFKVLSGILRAYIQALMALTMCEPGGSIENHPADDYSRSGGALTVAAPISGT